MLNKVLSRAARALVVAYPVSPKFKQIGLWRLCSKRK